MLWRIRGGVFAIDWETASRDYQRQGWVFLNPVFKEEFYREFLKRWPSKTFFEPPKRVYKWYNTGFLWKRENGGTPRYLDANPEMAKLFASLHAPEFEENVSEMAGVPLKFREMHATDSGAGAEVPMHLDSYVQEKDTNGGLGIAFFINGEDGAGSGGLAVARSTGWDEVLFEPEKLKNTALIYSKELHHGFRRIEKGKFRWSINTQFMPVAYRA